jgi:hypothetical protein
LKNIDNLPIASIECLDNSDPSELADLPEDLKVKLAQQLEAEGKRTLLVGQGIITIERKENQDRLHESLLNWGILKISAYSDPEITGEQLPKYLYLDVSKYGTISVYYDDGTELKELKL